MTKLGISLTKSVLYFLHKNQNTGKGGDFLPQKLPVSEVQRQLLALRQEIVRTKQEMDETMASMRQISKNEHIRQLLKAGRVVETAGILDNYDGNLLYLLLVMNRDYLCQKGYASAGTSRFEMMRGLDSILTRNPEEENLEESNDETDV